MDGGDDPPAAGTFELVEPCPVRGQVGRFEDLDVDDRTLGGERQCGVAEAGAPAGRILEVKSDGR